jgi:hypothetical protein
LKAHGVDVLIFPAHTTHILQPFGAAVLYPLQTAHARNLGLLSSKFAKNDDFYWQQLNQRLFA